MLRKAKKWEKSKQNTNSRKTREEKQKEKGVKEERK